MLEEKIRRQRDVAVAGCAPRQIARVLNQPIALMHQDEHRKGSAPIRPREKRRHPGGTDDVFVAHRCRHCPLHPAYFVIREMASSTLITRAMRGKTRSMKKSWLG